MNFGGIYLGVKKAWSVIKDVAGAHIDMIETNNLFEVSMGKVVDQYGNLNESASEYYTRALKFQNEMNERLATNRSELMKYQAMYFSMFKSQGIDKESSYKMSENLTKAGYDIASLYNLTVDEAMTKIKSGIAGQVEPLRTIGIDISESALTKVIRNAGISDRSVQQLSYAEKEVARYISIIEQAGQAQGDFAKTFEQPANQIRVFKNQLLELKQVAGAFITNTFGGIIVYANAIIMTIKEIIKSFATLLGYDLTSGGTSLSDTVGVDDLNAGLSSGIGKAKELKKQLMGFDEINNIEPQNQSGGSGGGVTGGIDNKLLESLKEWENRMGNITGKAQEIRDRMLEWLGVTDGSYDNLIKIWEIVKAIGVAFLAWKVSSSITALLKGLEIISLGQAFKISFGITLALTGIYLLYKGIERLLNGDIDVYSILETAIGAGATTLGFVTALKGIMTTMPIGTAFRISFGITLALAGVSMEYDTVKKMLEGDISLATILQGTGSAFLVGLGIALATGNVVAGLIGTAGVLAFNLGIEIGIALKKVDWQKIWNKITKACETAWESVEKFFKESVPNWWNENIAPWFTVEKWQEIGENMKQGLSNKWNEFKEWWGNTAMVQWWDENVAPWFTKEKWEEASEKALSGIDTKFGEWKENFKPISDWWDKHVAPWFTWEKWSETAETAKKALETKWNEWKNNFNPVQDWWNTKIAPWFTWERWKRLGIDAVNGMQNAFSNFNFKIKLPHFTWSSQPASGWIANVLSALNLPTSLPKLNVSWYASGGMPDMGEIFVAREAGPEMVGRIGNKTTVANNDQIVTAIKQGVYEAVRSAMPNGSAVRLDIRADEGIIVKKASEGFAEYVMQTGELPFPVPVG